MSLFDTLPGPEGFALPIVDAHHHLWDLRAGRAPSVAGPSQHNAECGVCGDFGGVAGKGALLCCARCPTAVHARCVSKRGEKRGRGDWLCAVCSDE